MSCGGRIYKGDAITVSIPFDVEEYSALTVAYFTTGDYEVVREESELVIEDGYIIASFEGHDLDILPDGVLRYTIACVVDDEDYLYSTNTPLYLKTPKDYDAETVEEVYEEGYESGSTDGYIKGFSDGHSSGVTDGIAEQKAKLESISIDADGFYTKEDGWSAVTVHVTKNYGTGSINMQAIEETYTKDSIRPMAPDGAAVYGGALTIFEGMIDQYREVRVYSWDNAQHTDRTEQGIFKLEDGVYVWSQTQGGPIVTHLDDYTNSWTQADNSGNLFIMKDGANLYLYQAYGFGVMFGDPYGHVVPNEEMILPTEGYDAISALTVNAINVYDSGYTSGHTDGYNEAYPVAWDEGYESGYTAGQEECSGRTGNYGIGNVNMQSITETFTKDSLRPIAPYGYVVYGGSKADFESKIGNGTVRICFWDNPEHSDWTLFGVFRNNNGVYELETDTDYPFDTWPSEWTNISGNIYIKKESENIFFYLTWAYGFYFTDDMGNVLPSEDMIFPVDYDAISAITVNAPLITSCWISFMGQQPISSGDILSVRVGGDSGLYDFALQDRRTWTGAYTYIDFYGYSTSHAVIDRIEITIPTSVYAQWGSCYPYEFNINHEYGMSNGIFGRPSSSADIIDNGDGTTSIVVRLKI